MSFHRSKIILFAAAGLLSASPALAGWKLMPARQPADLTGMQVTPQQDWNQASARPGKQGRAWTRDGMGLNGLEFFAAVPGGQPLYRERSKKNNPMPKFESTMLLPELADFFERSFRVQNELSDFSVIDSVPQTFGGHQGLRVRYRYTFPNDELVRLGEVRLAVVNKKLYVANYYAPELHYFPSGLAEAQAIMDGARF
jgi:hypothetical protein